MKKVISLFLSIVILISVVTCVDLSAYAIESGDYRYEILEDGTAEITAYTGSLEELVIPSVIDDYTVTSIGFSPFYGFTGLTSVIIPNSVTNIGDRAFENCGNLTSITIPDSVISIGCDAFEDCSSLTSVTIPNSVTNIGDHAFRSCSNLISVTIPNSVISIGRYTFGDCSSLTSVTIPNSVTSIDNFAFANCSSLTSVTISNSVTSIGSNAFEGCSSLTSIEVDNNNKNYSSQDGVLFDKNKTQLIKYPEGNKRASYIIPDSVTEIGYDAFENCSNLTSVTISDSVTSISRSAFYGCSSLASIEVDDDNKNYSSQDGVLFDKNKTQLMKYPERNAREYYIIPDSVTGIDADAFDGCSCLTSVTIPNSITMIGSFAFRNCSSLMSVTIPNSIINIGDYAFYDCSSLIIVTISDRVTKIGDSAFYGCSQLKDVYYNGTELEWNTISINSNNEYLTSATIHFLGEEIKSDYEYSVLDNGNIEITKYNGSDLDVIVPSIIDGYTVESVTADAFDNCQNVKTITFSDGVISVYCNCINCPNLETINIPSTVNVIDELAFIGELQTINDAADNKFFLLESSGNLKSINVSIENPNFSSINGILFNKDLSCLLKYPCGKETTVYEIPNTVKTFSSSAFAFCGSIEKLIIPASVETIENQVFAFLKYVKTDEYGSIIDFDSEFQTFEVSVNNTNYCSVDGVLYTQDMNTLVAYPNGKINKEFVTDNRVRVIDSYAFAYTKVENVNLSNVQNIEDNAFEGSAFLKEIKLTDSCKIIGSYSFGNCPSLTSIMIPDKILLSGVATFDGCINLANIALPSTMQKIPSNMFLCCRNLSEIYIPKSVTSIADNAFRDYNKLQTIYFGGTEEEWNQIVITEDSMDSTAKDTLNEILEKANVVFNSYPCQINGHKNYVSETIEPTCTEQGYKIYCCSVCGDTFKTNYVDALGHVEVIDEVIAPTCTETGLTEGKHCSRCNEILVKQNVVKALGHSFTNYVSDNNATCTEDGTKTAKCDRCDVTNTITDVGSALGHIEVTDEAVAPTCTETGLTEGKHCSRCNKILVKQNVVKALGHSFTDYVSDGNATCTQDGTKTAKCDRCDVTNTITDVNSALGHIEVIDEAVAPTCTETGLTEGKHCSRCNEILVKQNIVKALGHSWDEGVITKEPSCTETGIKTYTCSRCSDTKTETINKTEHLYTPKVIAPTCTEKGYTIYVCDACSADYISDYVDALGHDYSNEWTVDKEATCTSDGSKSHHCSRCDSKSDITVIKSTGHNYSEWQTRKAATCTDGGIDYRVCSVCGNEEIMITKSLGHNYDEWTVTKGTTVLCEGEEESTCTRCSNVEKRAIDKIKVDLNNTDKYGMAYFTVVNAQTKEPIKNAGIFISTENDGENTFFTDSEGKVAVVLPVGKQMISAYAEGCLTRNLNIKVSVGSNIIPLIGLSEKPTYDAKIEHHLMTKEEIEEAGIDTSALENQHVYKYELKLNFEPEIDWESIIAYFDGNGNFIDGYYGDGDNGDGEPGYSLHYAVNCGWRCSSYCKWVDVQPGENVSLTYIPERTGKDKSDYIFDGWYTDKTYTTKISTAHIDSYEIAKSYTTTVYGRWIYKGTGTPSNENTGIGTGIKVNDEITVYPINEHFWLIIRGEVKWLKEMFDVEMLVINNSSTDTLENLTATLNLPDGLSLATMVGDQQTLEKDIGTVPEDSSKSVHWYVRGDKAGSYNIEANLKGMVMPFEEEINDTYSADKALQVWAGNAMHLDFEFPNAAYYGEDYPIKITLTNVSDITLYNVNHMVQIEQGMEIYHDDGTVKRKIERSQWKSVGVEEFKPGDQIIIEASVNIFFKSERMERELEKLIGIIDGMEQFINGYKAVKTALDIADGLVNVVTGAVKGIDTFIESSADIGNKLALANTLKTTIVDFQMKYSKYSNDTFDSAIKLANSGVGATLSVLSENPDEWLKNSSEDDIRDLISKVKALGNSIAPDPTEEAIKNFNIFDSLRTLVSAIPIRFALRSVIMTEDENNTTSIPYTYSSYSTGAHYFGVSDMGSYMTNIAKAIFAETYEETVPSYIQMLPGCDDPMNYNDIKRQIIAQENELKQFKAKDATGNVTFKAYVVRNESSSLFSFRSSTQDDFIISCDNETAVVENGILTFTGDGTIGITPTSLTGGTLYIEDSEGNTYTYEISVVEQHKCSASEWHTVISPTAEFDGFAVKRCDTCEDILDVKTLSVADCTEHNFTKWEVDSQATATSQGVKKRSCTLCGYTDYQFTPMIDDNLDRSALDAAIEKSQSYAEGDYTPDSYEKLKEILGKCSDSLDELNSQESIDRVISEILTSISNLVPYLNLEVSANNGNVTVSYDDNDLSGGSYSVVFGTYVTLNAISEEGYRFDGWYEAKSNRIFSTDLTYTFPITSNVNFEARFIKENVSKLTFTNDSGQIISVVEKTYDEWNSISSIAELLPTVPYKFGYINGRWSYNESVVIRKLINGQNVVLTPVYDSTVTDTLDKPKELDNEIVLKLNYRYDSDNKVGSFIMGTAIPGSVDIEAVGMAFYYKKANTFDPTKFDVNINNKMLISQFDVLNDDTYITNMNKMNSTYNWAVKGYVTYYDELGELKTVYSNQINIANTKVVHSNIVTMQAVEPTCVDDGLTEGSYCADCGDIISNQEVISALGHSWNKGTVTFIPTCINEGEKQYQCIVCNETKSEIIPVDSSNHSNISSEVLIEASCSQGGVSLNKCDDCGKILGYKTIKVDHTWNDGEIIDEPTCSQQGRKLYTCTECGLSKVEMLPIDINNHSNIIVDKAIEPTCTTTGLTQGSHCVACEAVINAQIEIPIIEHEFVLAETVESTCKQAGRKVYLCSICKNESYTETLSLKAHTYSDSVTENIIQASCTHIGSYDNVVYCSVCGDELSRETVSIPMTAHTPVSANNSILPTCAESGKNTDTICEICGMVIENGSTINALGHNYEVNVVEPTCTEQGYTCYTCSRCGDSYNAEFTEKLNHDFLSNGLCKNCDEIEKFITINKSVTINCTYMGYYVEFIPEENGIYTFRINADYEIYCSCNGNSQQSKSITLNQKLYSGRKYIIYCENVHEGVINDNVNISVKQKSSFILDEQSSFEYTLLNNGTVEISGYDGNDFSIVIPSTIAGYNVTKIGNQAFRNCSTLNSIYIQNGVTYIDDMAFQSCKNLESIIIPNTVTSMGTYVFQNCESLNSITLSEEITYIEEGTFYNCKNLESLNIPIGVTGIGNSAFYNCSSLENVNIPNCVWHIGDYAFAKCSSLTSVILPASVTKIGNYAFLNCESLSDIYIKNPECLLKYPGILGKIIIHGYEGSTSQSYAEEHNMQFELIS